MKLAVILAAGIGRRLKEITEKIPKGFLRFGQKPIVEESVEKLMSCGILKIVIVTGHLKEFYETLAQGYPSITLIVNKIYDRSESMYSLACARDLIDRDFLLLDGDIIYERRALQAMIDTPHPNGTLISGPTYAGDEYYVSVIDGKIFGMSKNKAGLKNIRGEFVGISRISLSFYREMLAKAEWVFKDRLDYGYEECLDELSKEGCFYPVMVDDLLWAEVDDKRHYLRAKEKIYPRICENDSKYAVTEK